MQEILDSGACVYTRAQGHEWNFVEQSFVSSVRVEAVRNVDKLPTLAAMSPQHLQTLSKLQKEALAEDGHRRIVKGVSLKCCLRE